MGQLVAVSVEVMAVGGSPDLAAAQQKFENLGARNAGAKLASHRSRGAFVRGQVDSGGIRKISAMQ